MARQTSAPPGYAIEQNPLWQKMATLYGNYSDVGRGLYHTLLVIGPPGIGKSRGADQYLTNAGARVVWPRCSYPQLHDVLYRYRHKHIVMVWDDTDHIFNSESMMDVLKIVADAKGRRLIEDSRKVGHGKFLVNSRFVFITNKPINDPTLMTFDKTMRDHIAALRSRFQLTVPLSFEPLDCFHFACWMACDGKHLLRDVRFEGRSLSIDASNEVLAWFAANFNRLEEVSPRTLVANVADYRLKSPDVWQSLAEQWCLPEPRMVGTGKYDKAKKEIMEPMKNPEPWVIRAPSKTQVVVEQSETTSAEIVKQPDLPQDRMVITLRRTARGAHPIHATVFMDLWQAEVVEAKVAPPNRPALHKAFRTLGETTVGAEREDAAVTVAAFQAAERLTQADMEKYRVASVVAEPLPTVADLGARRDAEHAALVEKLNQRRQAHNAPAQ